MAGKLLGSRRSGAALVVVLSCLVLVAVVVVAFMAASATERGASRSYAEGGRARLIAQSAMDIVQGQIWAATTATDSSWASQPGAIRTFEAGSTNFVNVFKLYSSRMMVADAAFDAGSTNNPTEIPADWQSRPNQYVNLNSPVTNAAGLNFPILDPRAKDSANPTNSVSGFDFNSSRGATATNLPMPVEWIYQLKDGTLEAMNDAGKVPSATATNPIVGRLAFWTDDDTCKININTAGEGVFWDIPRGDSVKLLGGVNAAGAWRFNIGCEKAFIAYPPVQREYQRYPGHPSQISLKTVFPSLTADQLYALTPRVSLDDLGSNLSDSNSGNWRDWSITFPNTFSANNYQLGGVAPLPVKNERLYSSLDEVLFKPVPNSGSRELNQPSGQITPAALSRLQFFLTAYNRAPEINLQNKPRISMWPIPNNPSRRTAIDKWFARCSTIGDEAFYFTREQSQSPSYDYSNISRNQVLFSYLQNLTSSTIPGFAGSFISKFGADRNQILAEIFDYIRCTNLADLSDTSPSSKNIIYAASRDIPPSEFRASIENSLNFFGFGQVVPIQIAGSRGLGRFDTISEITLLIYRMQWNNQRTVRVADNYPSVNDASDRTLSVPVAAEDKTSPPLFRAVLLVEPFNPSQGFYPSVPDYQITINGLDKISVGNSTIGFSSGQTNVIKGTYNNGGHAGGATGNAKAGVVAANFDGWTGGASGKTSYVFTSKPFQVPGAVVAGEFVPNSTFPFNGSNGEEIELIIKNRTGETIQTFRAVFPPANLPTPAFYGNTLPSPAFSPRIRTAIAHQPQFICPTDVVVSLEPGGAAADLRWLTAQSTLPATAFVKHKDYDNPQSSPSGSAKAANSLRDNLKWTLQDSNATFGSLVKDLTTGSPADISSNINGVLNALGHPGDWDTGFGDSRDGPYINKPDELNCKYKGSATARMELPYFQSGDTRATAGFDTFFAPNRMVPSPGMLGSLPSRIKANGPWETLLFNPNPAAGDNHRGFGANKPNGQDPPDYLWMDLFTMPIIEPYAISEPFSTAGKVNLNYQMIPFTYISRSTAINAVLAANRVTAIHDADGIDPTNPTPNPKIKTGNGNYDTDIRHLINIPETLRQFEEKFEDNAIFRSAAEICSIDLYPLVTSANMPRTGSGSARLSPDQPSYSPSRAGIKSWWSNRRLTGDNVREQPYTTLYQNLTTQSNTYTIHVWAQAIQKPPGSPADEMASRDAINGEYRVAYSIERFIDPNNPNLPDFAQAGSPSANEFYQFRVNNTKQFVP